MKKILLLIVLVCCMLQPDVQAQYSDRPDAIMFKLNRLDYYTPNTSGPRAKWADMTSGAEIAYSRQLKNWLDLTIPARIGYVRLPEDIATNWKQLGGSIDALLHLKYMNPDCWISPYLLAGIGANMYERAGTIPQIPLGLGANVKLSSGVWLNLQTEYRKALGEDKNRNNWVHGLGLNFMLGSDKPKDTDGDGLTDDIDKCPLVPGLSNLMGCPDADKDGISDLDDKCPDVPGIAELMGCPEPDDDKDGVPNKSDKCPTTPGKANLAGCPDRDNDGIADGDDKCPDKAGIAAFMGCPDRDKDGIQDSEDGCPDEPGTKANNGCPVKDRDKDGVMDSDDKCPDKPGPASNKGCPEMTAQEKQVLTWSVKSIQFETNSDVLKSESYPILDEVASILGRYPEYRCMISGHTDNVGPDASNLDLSTRRASRCLNYLVSKGISASRLSSSGFGETSPIGDNNTAEGRKMNRRVEFDVRL